MKLKKIHLVTLWAGGAVISALAQNPICPPGLYIADPTARVWDDGMLYVYGSRDDENLKTWCSHDHWVMRTEDLVNWEFFPRVFASKGENDGVPYSDRQLFAPDAMYKDGTYYLYFCQPGKDCEGVAVSPSPTGPFIDAKKMNIGKHNQIDPTVFIDDDGQAYYSWGQGRAKIAKLKPNMTEIDESTIIPNVLTENEHFFHEGNFMTKRNGIYYMVYTSIELLNSGKKTATRIAYASSDKPMGPYTYGGCIIDNMGCDPKTWNNHGSIVEFKGRWYVFYHRTTHNSAMRRKACIEPISFNEDGSIPQVEMTSQGAGGPLDAFCEIEAERACYLRGNVRIETLSLNKENLLDPANNNRLGGIKDGDCVGYKYIDFGTKTSQVEMHVFPEEKLFEIEFRTGAEDGPVAGLVTVPAQTKKAEWITVIGDISVQGVQALYLTFRCEDQVGTLGIDKFSFK